MEIYALEKRFLLKLNSSKCRKRLNLYEKRMRYRDYAYIYRCEVFQEWLFLYLLFHKLKFSN